MEKQILDIIKVVLETEDIDETVSQKNCEKWDSMAQLNLVVELEAEFGIELEPEEIGEMISYNDVCRLVKAKLK